MINRLITSTDEKVERISAYFLEREKNVTSLAHSTTIVNTFKEFQLLFEKGKIVSLDNKLFTYNYNSIEKGFGLFYMPEKESTRYYDLFLISPEGDVVYTATKGEDFGTNLITGLYKDSELAQVFKRTKTFLETSISDYKHYAPSRERAVFVAAPILSEEEFIGVIVLQIDNEDITGIVNDYTGLGTTGETVVATRVVDEAVFTMPTRHDPYATFRIKIPPGSKKGLPILKAVNGNKGSGLSVDYRGKQVLAVWRYLPRIRWGVVVKQDTSEAFAPVSKLKRWSVIIGITTMIGVAIVVLFVSRSISGPITQLTESTKIIGQGDLHHKVDIVSHDEIGQLADSFNSMTAKLKNAYSKQKEINTSLQREIDERKLAEEKIRKLSYVVEQSPSAVVITDINGDIEYVNHGFSQLTGYTDAEVIGKNPRILKSDKTSQETDNDLWETIESGKEWSGVFCNKKKSGELFWESASISPLKDPDGNITHYVALKEDITEKIQAEELMKHMVEDIQRSNKELEQFAYVASHDLQEPLRMVASYMQLLQRRYKDKLDNDANDFINYAVDGSKRMQALIHDLLAYSRVGSRVKELEPVDTGPVLDRAIKNLEKSIKDRGAIVMHGSMPTVFADGPQITQLFQNLIGNAIKYHSKATPRIQVSAKQNEKDITFSVSDNGIGIESQYYERIFTIFQRLHGKSEYSGTGIGLAICKKIVERHNGKIWVESLSGEGSIFYFTIPKK
ncbi:MAG: PAS domain S-box protein [Candidatus Scalindua sp.]|nr:PAS domain S-box protein [Candidatus Scalindua sp.]MBT6560921.1 PAS domain S-box protein [Candidatus Scalindua sp.]